MTRVIAEYDIRSIFGKPSRSEFKSQGILHDLSARVRMEEQLREQAALATATLLADDPALKNVRVTVKGSAPPILADAGLLKIVFLNLLVNGAHAMRGSGTAGPVLEHV